MEVYSAGKRKRMVLPFKFILFLNVTILVRFSLLVKLVFHIVKFLAEYKLMYMEWTFTCFFSFVFSELLKETIFFCYYNKIPFYSVFCFSTECCLTNLSCRVFCCSTLCLQVTSIINLLFWFDFG